MASRYCKQQGSSFRQAWEQTSEWLTVESPANLHNEILAWQCAVSGSSVFTDLLLAVVGLFFWLGTVASGLMDVVRLSQQSEVTGATSRARLAL